jgi:hypothetical protein
MGSLFGYHLMVVLFFIIKFNKNGQNAQNLLISLPLLRL